MNRLRLFILIFLLTTSVPLAFVIYQSYSGLKQEERAQLRFFSTTLFDQIEEELAALIQEEELRTVDEYQHFLATPVNTWQGDQRLSPLAKPGGPAYILGYFQNNPDGSMQTPLVEDLQRVPERSKQLITRLREANTIFNRKKIAIPQTPTSPKRVVPKIDKEVQRKQKFAERFLKQPEVQEKSTYLGKREKRIEEITEEQALNIVQEDRKGRTSGLLSGPAPSSVARPSPYKLERSESARQLVEENLESSAAALSDDVDLQASDDKTSSRFQVEVAPFQSVTLNDDKVFMFRRIEINNQIYRQGFVVLIGELVAHLTARHYSTQPLADFTTLSFQRRDQGQTDVVSQTGDIANVANLVNRRLFPAPFDFLSVSLTTHTLPPSPARTTLNMALAVLGAFMFLGLIAIYQSARAIVALSERRSQFVSSVTHELKTPLTNIRMYIEMLEQGVATSPEREQAYLAVLATESGRLSSLINNVLELAKLEKKQRNFNFREGNLDDVLDEVETIMSQKINQEGFSLTISKSDIPTFSYDREVVIQILVNLIENSLKFGKDELQKEISIVAERAKGGVRIDVSDTGPGIPKGALKKVFADFYRVDNALTRKTGGTGIGLALVKKFVTALGGEVKALNNSGPGCTITLVLPLIKEAV